MNRFFFRLLFFENDVITIDDVMQPAKIIPAVSNSGPKFPPKNNAVNISNKLK